MPYLDYDKSLSDQSTGFLQYCTATSYMSNPSSAHPPSSYIRLDAVLLGQVGNLHMVFKQVIGRWLSLVNSILCLPLREPGRLLERMILGSHTRHEHISTKNWRDDSVQLHSSFSSMHKPLTMQLVSSFQASSIGVGTCFLMTSLNSSSYSAFLFPVLLPSHKLFQKLFASLISLNISSPFKLFFLVYLRPSFSLSRLSLSYACIQRKSINLELLIDRTRLLLLFHSNKALLKICK